MTYKVYTKIMSRLEAIAKENEVYFCDLVVKIRTKSGEETKAWAQDLNGDNEVLEIFADDSFKFIPYENIESITI